MERNGKQSNRWSVGGVILFVWLSAAFSQGAQPPAVEWERTFGGAADEEGYCVVQTRDGGFVIAGSTAPSWLEDSDAYVVKTDGAGNLQWQRTFGGTEDDVFKSVAQTSDGSLILAGHRFLGGNADMYLVKTDSSGNLTWEKMLLRNEHESGQSIRQTADGGYVVAGFTMRGSWGGEQDIYLLKTDSTGNPLWERTWGGTDDDGGQCVRQTVDGGFVVAGGEEGPVGQEGMVLIKTDAAGNTAWYRKFRGDLPARQYIAQMGEAAVQTPDGGYLLAGYRNTGASYVFPDGRLSQGWFIKTDSNGILQWERDFGGLRNERFYDMQQTSDGGFIAAGHSDASGNPGFYLVKTDSSGNLQWQTLLGGSEFDRAYSIQQTSDGGYIVAGSTDSFGAGGRDIYLVKLAKEGQPPPTGISASDGTYTDKVRVTWNTSPDAAEFQVSRATSSLGAKTTVSDWLTSTTYDDVSANVATAYHYWVKARGTLGESSFSAPDTGWRAPEPLSARPSWRLYE